MSNQQEYIFVKESIPSNVEDNTIFNISTREVNQYTHGFHKYPAKFIPDIPKWAIEKYLNGEKNKVVFDPFSGSGTTLVEAMIAGHNGIGIDIDPLSVLISKVKTTSVDIILLNKIIDWLIIQIESNRKGTFIPSIGTIEHWFTLDAINKLSRIRTFINEIPEIFGEERNVKDIQDLIFVCFSSIIRKVSNADNESQKTYVSHTKIKIPEEVNTLFLSQIDFFKNRIIEFSKLINTNINSQILVTSSSKSLNNVIDKKQIDLVITSPPYIKAIDYIYNQMVELFWIGDLFEMQTQTKQNKKKKQYIGNKQIPKTEYEIYDPNKILLDIDQLDNDLQDIYSTDKKNGHKHSYITYKYFIEMEQHFSEMSKCLDKGVHYVMVVGNSKVSNIAIDTAQYLIDIANRNNFDIVNKWGYKIKNRFMRFDRKGRGGIIKVDWVMDFVKK